MKTITSTNPATEQICSVYPLMEPFEVDASIAVAARVQQEWAGTTFANRASHMRQLAKLMREVKMTAATLITCEMGKPITQALAEVEKCALLCEFYAKEGSNFFKPELIKTDFYKSYRSFHPLGVIFAIMPWNFPFWQVMRFAVPNLMAGNAGILRHASNCFGTSLFIEELFTRAGFPKGLFHSVIVDIESIPAIIQHPKIAGVTLTGSSGAGRSVAREAGSALKKVVLELGGNDPYIILEDADLEFAARECVKSRLNNCGQVCIAAKRLIVDKKVKMAFEALVIKEAKHYTFGNPQDASTLLGPMARKDLRETLHNQVTRAIAKGARCVLGGEMPERTGYYYPVTVLLDVMPDSPAFQEELFGPVICITPADDENHALMLANQSEFGLAGAIFTRDKEKGEEFAKKLDAGTCAVNTLVSSNPRLPFGGIKQSGYGRELSVEGMREFVNIKTIIVND